MVKASKSLLDNKYLNGWNLLGLVSFAITSIVVVGFSGIDPSKPEQISLMIATSVRTAVPWLFVAFAASSLLILFPNKITKWIMKNRKYIGLCFAVGMTWQLFFIFWYVFGFNDYYMAKSYSIHSLVEQVPGYLVLSAMVITSFKAGRNMLTGKQWRILHKFGIYLLWGVLFSTYWYELYYYDEIQAIDQIYYAMGISAWLMRIAAWGKKRGSHKKFKMASGELSPVPLLNQTIALALTVIGLVLIIFGQFWALPALQIVSKLFMGAWIEHFTPFLPVIPLYLAALTVSARHRVN